MPGGPPILCAEIETKSAPSDETSIGILAAACTASTCSGTPACRARAANSARGCSAPVSLLAAMIDIKAVPDDSASRASPALARP
jgi:hypothetical protein